VSYVNKLNSVFFTFLCLSCSDAKLIEPKSFLDQKVERCFFYFIYVHTFTSNRPIILHCTLISQEKDMLVAREELGKLVQKIKEKQEKVRDNANLGDTGPRQQAFLQLPWH
jgi:hypothetical protein